MAWGLMVFVCLHQTLGSVAGEVLYECEMVMANAFAPNHANVPHTWVLCIFLDWCKSQVLVGSQGKAEMLLQLKLLTKGRELLLGGGSLSTRGAEIPNHSIIPDTSLVAALHGITVLTKGR